MVRVPASSANLGPGFDTLGLALDIHLKCQFRTAPKLRISARGRDAALIPCDDTNLIWKTAVRLGEIQNKEMPPIELELINDIPIGKGLGSSAAALLTGVAVANCVLDLRWSRQRILDEASRLEGHPDNVSAAVLGSFVAATIDSKGCTKAIRLDLPARLRVAVVCPDYVLDTEHMRTVLPESYSKEDTIFNLQRATLLVAALAAGNRDVFPECLQDRLHQPYRSPSIPGMGSVLTLRAPGLLGCALSGAGPAILVFYEDGSESVVDLVQEQFLHLGRNSDIFFSRIDREGLQIETDG
jgi:homoserine kinase